MKKKIRKGAVYKNKVKIGFDLENSIKDILKDNGFTIIEELSNSRPIDIFGYLRFSKGNIGVLIEAKDIPKTNISVPQYNKITQYKYGKKYPFNGVIILKKAEMKTIEYLKSKNMYIPIIKVIVTTGQINNGFSAMRNFKYNLYVVKYDYLIEWLHTLKRLHVGRPLNKL